MQFDWEQLAHQDYYQISAKVLHAFLGEFSEKRLCEIAIQSYTEFDLKSIVGLRQLNSRQTVLELFHGPTLAFKDMALSIFPNLLTEAIRQLKIDGELVILTATSGDTGSAALHGFSDVDQTKIIVYYPSVGVSRLQSQLMSTQTGGNVHVVSVEGNFDDAQKKVKHIINSGEIVAKLRKNNQKFSSANSINIGRLTPQIVYYVYAYAQLVGKNILQEGELLDVTVPTGNFGNILAAFYAKKIGVPLGRFTIASNKNNVLTDFVKTGLYDRRREFKISNSPSMDILVSSNLERLLFELTDRNSEKVRQWMLQLETDCFYQIDELTLEKLQEQFSADYASDEDVAKTIKDVYEKYNYLIDPHTAVGIYVGQKLEIHRGGRGEECGSGQGGERTKRTEGRECAKGAQSAQSARHQLFVSTASPFKFTDTVISALGEKPQTKGDGLSQLSQLTGESIPPTISDVFEREVIFDKKLKIEQIEQDLERFLGI
jgi:threonine synthase